MGNSFTIPFLISFVIGLVVVVLGGAEYQAINTDMVNKVVNVDNNNFEFSDSSKFVDQSEGDVDVTNAQFGFVDGLKLVFQFLVTVPVNAIAMPVTLVTIADMPIAFIVLFAIPLGLLNLLGLVGIIRGAL